MRYALVPCLALLMALLGLSAPVGAEDKPSPAGKEAPDAKPFDDAEFVMMAASGGMLEVELGKLATDQADMPDVKKFGKMLVEDHTKANAELMKIAKANKLALPEKPMEKHQKECDRFKDLKGAEFDKAFVPFMIKDHEQDIADFTKASKEAKNPELREFASMCLPKLKEHLKMAKELGEKVK